MKQRVLYQGTALAVPKREDSVGFSPWPQSGAKAFGKQAIDGTAQAVP
jgi:hypothetical protein